MCIEKREKGNKIFGYFDVSMGLWFVCQTVEIFMVRDESQMKLEKFEKSFEKYDVTCYPRDRIRSIE